MTLRAFDNIHIEVTPPKNVAGKPNIVMHVSNNSDESLNLDFCCEVAKLKDLKVQVCAALETYAEQQVYLENERKRLAEDRTSG